MTRSKAVSRSGTILRWIARIWSLLLLTFVVARIFMPDPYATEPVPPEDWFLLSLWGLAVLFLLVAWRWEIVGGILVIVTMCLRELAWVLIKGQWFLGFLILWAVVAPPAILFVMAAVLERRARATAQEAT
jgi:hypothetical protein